MSNFIPSCEKCGTDLISTIQGYITGCEHYPADEAAIEYFIHEYLKVHVSQLHTMPPAFIRDWKIGQELYHARKPKSPTSTKFEIQI